MDKKFNVVSTKLLDNGHKQIKLKQRTSGNVWLYICGRSHRCDSIKSARALAQSISRNVLTRRDLIKKGEKPFESEYRCFINSNPWVDYKIIIRTQDDTEPETPLKMQTIVEQYPQGKPLHGYEKGQAGRPESNRRKF